MSRNNFSSDDIKSAILKVYDSVEEYAVHKKTSKQNIYEKIRNQSNKFLRELEKDGIFIVKEEFSMEMFREMQQSITQLKADMYDLQLKINEKDKIINEQAELISLLQDGHEEKDMAMLEMNKQIQVLRVQCGSKGEEGLSRSL